MKISDYLVKKQWSRRAVNPSIGQHPSKAYVGQPRKMPMSKPSGACISFSQDKFLDEINSGAHIVFDSNYRSKRVKYKYDAQKKKNVRNGYEDVTRIGVSWQQAIRENKTATCGGNNPWFGNEGKKEDADLVNVFKSYCNVTNLRAALINMFYSLFGTGDAALYFYKDDDTIKWRCFSYENGDNCNLVRDYENPSKDMGVRYFDFEGHDAVELYREKYVELYIRGDNVEDLKAYFPKGAIETTEDGFSLVSREEHGLDEMPFCYFREKDIPSGPVQGNCEYWEQLLSDCGENVKYYAYQIMFITGGAMSLPNPNFQGKVLGSKTTDGDAKILEPADASNTLTIAFQKDYDAIRDGSKSVFIKPEDLKGQNDSGAYIANLYWPEIQWAIQFYGRFHPCMQKIIRVIKKLVGLIEGKITSYIPLKISYEFEPFIPKNAMEQSQILQNAVTTGYLSVETATEEFDSANPLEMERITRETEEKDKREAAKAEREFKQKQAMSPKTPQNQDPEPNPKPKPKPKEK